MHTGDTGRQKPRSVPKNKEKLNVLIVKRAFSEIISPVLLAPGLVKDGYQSDVRHLVDGCQLVWIPESFGGEVTRGLPGRLMYNQAWTQD